MSYFIRNGINFNVSPDGAIDMYTKLPAGNYIIKQDPYENLFLQKVDDFVPVKKVYGNINRYADRILETYSKRNTSTGVLLTGEKGSGKTLLAKQLSIDLAKRDVPTIIINSPWTGDKFNKFLQDIDQECVVMFDEFEKVYNTEAQEVILTLLDGVFPSSKLFLLTCNDKWRVDSHMRNRPGRIFYMIDFAGLDSEFIREYCNDALDDKHHIDKICEIALLFKEFNFDMLKSLVEEMNRYNESPQDSMLMLNAKPEFGGDNRYTINIVKNGVSFGKNVSPSVYEGNPLNDDSINVHYKAIAKKPSNDTDCVPVSSGDDDDDGGWGSIVVTQANLIKILPQEGRFVFVKDDFEITLTKVVEYRCDWRAF